MSIDEVLIEPMKKITTGIKGFDWISDGGLPENRTTLISGTAGSGKTILAAQFLMEGIKKEDCGAVYVTFEESPEDIRHNLISFNWDVRKLEEEGKWAFVDASLSPEQDVLVSGTYDLGALLARIEYAVKKVNAKRVSIDSFGAIYTQFNDTAIIRRELFRISSAMKRMGVTVLLTAERPGEYGKIARQGVEEFVSDNVMILRNIEKNGRRRRTIEILKFRGTTHKRGEFPFTISPDDGIVIIPMVSINLVQRPTDARIKSGIPEFDEMCCGGMFRDSITLVAGHTGTGKTLIANNFIKGGVENSERSLFFAFEESIEQLYRNASSCGIDLKSMEASGLLKIVSVYPESSNFEDHLLTIYKHIDDFKPSRIALDSLSSLQSISTLRGFREFVIGISSYVKERQIASLYTSSSLIGNSKLDDVHLSTITDTIVLLKHTEIDGEIRRGIMILKMRGSRHDNRIREFTIDDTGINIGDQFRSYLGAL